MKKLQWKRTDWSDKDYELESTRRKDANSTYFRIVREGVHKKTGVRRVTIVQHTNIGYGHTVGHTTSVQKAKAICDMLV